MFLSYRNQFIDLLCKSVDWFLYDRGLRHERVKIGKFDDRNDRLRVANLFRQSLVYNFWTSENWLLGFFI